MLHELGEIERIENLKYTVHNDYSQEDLQEHRERYSIEERRVLIIDPRNFNDVEKSMYKRLVKSSVDSREANQRVQEIRTQRIHSIMEKVYHKDLISTFSGLSSPFSNLRKIRITKEAYDKSNLIAKRMLDSSPTAHEIYMHPLDFDTPEDNVIIRDVFIPYQNTSPSRCSPKPGKTIKEDEREIREANKRIVGWSHSHALFDTFHSPTDDHNLDNITSIYGTERTIYLSSFSSENPRAFSFFILPSLVFNAKGDPPSLAVAFEYNDFNSYEPRIHVNNSPLLEVLNEQNNIDRDPNSIDHEIWKKVNPSGGFSRPFIKRMSSPTPTIIPSIDRAHGVVPIQPPSDLSKEKYALSAEDYLYIVKEISRLREKTNTLEERLGDAERKIKEYFY